MKGGVYLTFVYYLSIGVISALLPANWDRCREQMFLHKNKVDTMGRVARLRDKMAEFGIHAYIVPTDDFHMSDAVMERDRRLEYISGFKGFKGTAVVTMDYAALWVEKKNLADADEQLGCGWLIGDQGEDPITSISQWLGNVLPQTATTRVGGCPYFFRYDVWLGYAGMLSSEAISLVGYTPGLVDLIWTVSRPQIPDTDLNPLPLKFAGRRWQDKVNAVHAAMKEKKVDLMVLSGLGEASWLLNLRGSLMGERNTDTLFYSLMIVNRRRNRTRLYVKDHWHQMTETETGTVVAAVGLDSHLNTGHDGSCRWIKGSCVELKEYNYARFARDLRELSSSSSVSRVWLPDNSNYAIFSTVPDRKVFVAKSPVTRMRLVKNTVEVEGIKRAHIRDGVAIVRFLAGLERDFHSAVNWTLHSVAEKLKYLRSLQDHYRDTGWVGNRTRPALSRHGLFVLNSPSRYLDGSADIGRTLLFGEPTALEKTLYTRTLKGQIDLTLATWRSGLYGRELEALARGPLTDIPMAHINGTYPRQSQFLQRHSEHWLRSPGEIQDATRHPMYQWDLPIERNMFFTIEPGYTLDEGREMLLKNVVMVKDARTKYKRNSKDMLQFETVTLVPYEHKLINYSLLADHQIRWLNRYNYHCRTKVGSILLAEGYQIEYYWLMNRTQHIPTQDVTNSSTKLSVSFFVFIYFLVNIL